MDSNEQIREGYIKLIIEKAPNVILTLGAGRSISPITFESKVKHFFNCVQRGARGRNWSKWSAESKPIAIGFNEKPDTNPHMHLAVKLEPDLIPAFRDAEIIWREIRPAGHYYFNYIEAPEKYARYITKTFYLPTTSDEPFVYYGSSI